MLWQNKISWSETIALAALWKINQKEGDTFSDALVIGGATLGIARVWRPEIIVIAAGWAAPAIVPVGAAIMAPVAVGGVVSLAIGGTEGVKNYGDFIMDVPFGKGQREKFKDVVIPAIESEIIEPIKQTINEEIIQPISHTVNLAQNIIQNTFINPILELLNFHPGLRKYRAFRWF
jgi:hypothetical protein